MEWKYTLTYWGRVTHICISNLTIIGSDNGLSPDGRQAIVSTNAGILLIGPLGTNFSEILIKIMTFSFKEMRSNVSSGKRRPSCLRRNVLTLFWSHIIDCPLGDVEVILKVRSWKMIWIKFMITCEMHWGNATKPKSILVHVMAWYHQATNHCLSQSWSRSVSPYGFTGPQWENASRVTKY